jgi:hypothetical protein
LRRWSRRRLRRRRGWSDGGVRGGWCKNAAVVVAPLDTEVEWHPNAVHVSGPHNLSQPNRREIDLVIVSLSLNYSMPWSFILLLLN